MTWFRLALVAAATFSGFTPIMADATRESEGGWAQFRGPEGTAAAPDPGKLPVHFGPNQKMQWKTPVPSGNSSPCISGDRIFVTAFEPAKQLLETLCLDRRTGRILWRQSAPAVAKIETSLHPTNGPATPTPAADGRCVYVYFG